MKQAQRKSSYWIPLLYITRNNPLPHTPCCGIWMLLLLLLCYIRDQIMRKKEEKKQEYSEKNISPTAEEVRKIRSVDELYNQTSYQMLAQSPQRQLGTPWLGVQAFSPSKFFDAQI